MSNNDIITAAILASASYSDQQSAEAEVLDGADGFTHFVHIDAVGNQQVMIAFRGRDEAWVAFRGTELHELLDVIRNARFTPVQSLLGSAVHNGFCLNAESVYDQIEHEVVAVKKVYLVGHSAGAAAAGIIAGYLAKTRSLIDRLCNLDRLTFIGFGCPRFATKEFNDTLTSLVDCTLVTHNSDPVPWVPPVPYRTLNCRRIHFKRDGGLLDPHTTSGYLLDQRRGVISFLFSTVCALLTCTRPLSAILGSIKSNGSHYMSRYLLRCQEDLCESSLN